MIVCGARRALKCASSSVHARGRASCVRGPGVEGRESAQSKVEKLPTFEPLDLKTTKPHSGFGSLQKSIARNMADEASRRPLVSEEDPEAMYSSTGPRRPEARGCARRRAWFVPAVALIMAVSLAKEAMMRTAGRARLPPNARLEVSPWPETPCCMSELCRAVRADSCDAR